MVLDKSNRFVPGSTATKLIVIFITFGFIIFHSIKHIYKIQEFCYPKQLENKIDLFEKLWFDLKDKQEMMKIREILISDLQEEVKLSEVKKYPDVTCPTCPHETCTEHKCPACDVDREDSEVFSGHNRTDYLKSLAIKYLVTDFEPVETEKKITIFDFKSSFSELNENISCGSNPELNPYIYKPKFSRDQHDYDSSRKSSIYQSTNKLVCNEISEHLPKGGTFYIHVNITLQIEF